MSQVFPGEYQLLDKTEAAELIAAWDAAPVSREAMDGYLRDIGKWADFRFTVLDREQLSERTFAFFEFDHSIQHRMEAYGIDLSKREREWLHEQHGAIVELTSDDPVLWFSEPGPLLAAWIELHQLWDVPLTQDEREHLDMGPEED